VDGEYFIVDGVVRGLWIRIYPNGTRVFVLRFVDTDGRRVQKRLGEWPALSLDLARIQALAILTQAKEGNPQTLKRRTFQEVAEQYLSSLIIPKVKQSTLEEYRYQLDHMLNPILGAKNIRAVGLEDVMSVLKSYDGRPMWNRLLVGLLRPIFKFAMKLNYADINPADAIGKVPEKPRKPRLTQTQIESLHRAINSLLESQEISIYNAWAFRLLLGTGARTAEILNLRWDFLDAENHLINWDDSKTGEKAFPLTPVHQGLLDAIPRLPGHPFVFPGRRPGLPLTTLSKPWIKVRRTAGLPTLHLHDLRHIFGTRSRQISDPMVAKDLLGLKTMQMVVVYATPSPTELAQVAEETCRYMLAGSGLIHR
jgi:integrase